MRTRRHLSKHLTKIAATVALVAGAAGVAGVGTFGAYTDTTKAEAAITSDKVSVLINGSDTGVQVPIPDMVTSDTAQFPITVERAAGSAELSKLNLATTVTGDAGLAGALKMSLAVCSVPWTPQLTCTGTTTPVLTNGPLVMNTAIPVTEVNAGAKFYVRATVALPANAAPETADKAVTITWTVSSEQRTGKNTVITPVAVP